MNKEEFVDYYIKALDIEIFGEPKPSVRVTQELIGSIYDQQQMIDYLDNRIIDLERIIYK